ncbi:hypothetical protein DL767_004425 [Monosporascus sp. MG133]|nr:hypothetical protein DL767_004425 [Monosporascus sp. MG133]
MDPIIRMEDGNVNWQVLGDSMNLIHIGTEPVVNVIFVHGLFGGPGKTWAAPRPRKQKKGTRSTNDSGETSSQPKSTHVFWPKDLLPAVVKNASVYSFGYDAEIQKFMRTASLNTVFEHSRDLLNALSDIQDEQSERPLPFIFIAHSLGGVVVKSALSQASAAADKRLQEVVQGTLGVIFIGTPHRGATAASYGKFAFRLTKILAFQSANTKLLTALEKNSAELDILNSIFVDTVKKFPNLLRYSFVDTDEIRLAIVGLRIVPPDSARIGDEEWGTIKGDHRQVAKFTSLEDPGFEKVTRVLHRWIRGILEQTRQNDYRQIAIRLGLDIHALQADEIIALIRDWLRKKDKWLMVFDNANNDVAFKRNAAPVYYPIGRSDNDGLIVIVSSAPEHKREATIASVEVGAMEEEEAIQLLQNSLTSTNSREAISSQILKEVVRAVGCHPLSIYLIAGVEGWLDEDNMTDIENQLRIFLEDFREFGPETRRAFGVVWKAFEKQVERIRQKAESVSDGDQLMAQNALRVLHFLAFVDHRDISELIFRWCWHNIQEKRDSTSQWRQQRQLVPLRSKDRFPQWNRQQTRSALTLLKKLHLVNYRRIGRQDNFVISMHPLVHLYARQVTNIGPAPWEIAIVTLAECMSRDSGTGKTYCGVEPRETSRVVHRHIVSCLRLNKTKAWFVEDGEGKLDRANIGLKIALALSENGELDQAIELQESITSALHQYLSQNTDDSHTTITLYMRAKNELSISYMDRGRRVEALRILRTITSSGEGFPPADVLKWKANLAKCYFYEGAGAKALDLRKEVLDSYSAMVQGFPPSSGVISAMRDYAASLENVGQKPQTLHLREHALALVISSKDLTPEKLDETLCKGHGLTSLEIGLLSDLATSYNHYGRYLDARKIRQVVLEVQEGRLSELHADTLAAKSNLAETKKRLGEDVREMTEGIFKQCEKGFGVEHPRTLAAKLQWAESIAMVDLETGLKVAHEVLETRRCVLPLDHHDTLYTMNRLIGLYMASDREQDHSTAYKYQQYICDARNRLSGEGDYQTILARNRLADCLSLLKHHVDAKNLRKTVLRLHLEHLHDTSNENEMEEIHPDTLSMKSKLANDYLLLSRNNCFCFKPDDDCTANVLSVPSSVTATDESTTVNSGGPLRAMGMKDDEASISSSDHVFLSGRDAIPSKVISTIRQERKEKALLLAREVLKERVRILSKKHHATIGSMKFLAQVLGSLNYAANREEIAQLSQEADALLIELRGAANLKQERKSMTLRSHFVRNWLEGVEPGEQDQNSAKSTCAVGPRLSAELERVDQQEFADDHHRSQSKSAAAVRRGVHDDSNTQLE